MACCLQALESIAEAIAEGAPGRVALVVRSRDMAAGARREALSMTKAGAAFAIPIYTIDRFASMIARAGRDRAGRQPRPMGELEREIVMGGLLMRRAGVGELAALGQCADRPGVARAFADAILQMKEAMVSPDHVERALSGAGSGEGSDSSLGAGGALAPVHADFLAVWRDYEAFLKAHCLVDKEDMCADAIDALHSRGRAVLGDLQEVWFEQFFDAAPIEAALIAAVGRLVPATHVRVTCAECDDADMVLERISRLVAPADVEVNVRARSGSPRTRTSDFSIIAAPGPAAEAREVAREVKRLILEEGHRPWEICVASADSAEFIPALLEVFAEFGVPCAAPRKRLLSSSMLVLDCVALADATASRHAGFDFVRLLASPYIGPGPAYAARVVSAMNVKGLKLTTTRWKARCAGIDECDEALVLLETLDEVWNDDFGKSRGLAARVDELGHLLTAVGAPMSIVADDNLDWAVQSWAAWGSFNALLDEIARSAEALGGVGSQGDWAEFARILGTAIRRRSFPLERPDPAGVQVVGPARGAETEWPVLFLSQMAEGKFPRRMRRSWIFRDDDLERLARSGARIMLARDFAAMERFIFNSAVASADERLYITYPSSGSDGTSVRRSFFVDELLDSWGVSRQDENAITTFVSPRDIFPRRWNMAASPVELNLCALAHARALDGRAQGGPAMQAGNDLRRVREWGRQRPDLREVASWWKEREARARGHGYSVFSGRIEARDLQQSLGSALLHDTVWSAGHFDDYLRCPFAFFCSRVLGLGAVEEAPDELTSLTRGAVLHSIMREFFSAHIGSRLVPSKIDEYRSQMSAIVMEELDRVDVEATNMSGTAWEAYRDSILRQAIQTLDAQVELADKTDGFWSPAHLEWSFGLALRPGAAPSSVREYLILPGDEAGDAGDACDRRAARAAPGVRVGGRVDRIDASQGGAYAIYDYKLGRSASLPTFTQIKRADQVQLGVYIMAVESLLASESEEVAGAWYYSLRDNQMASGVWRDDYHDQFAAARRRGGRLSGDEWREYVDRVRASALEAANQAAAGVFHIAPQNPSSCGWCDFRRVCRIYMLDLETLGRSAGDDNLAEQGLGGDGRG